MKQDRSMKKFWVALISVSVAVSLFPLVVTSEYSVRIATIVLLWIGMAGCWNLMSGYTGYIDFGPVVYFGLGSYTTAIVMTKYGALFFPSVVLAGVVAALMALPIGISTLRLKGAYFAIATFRVCGNHETGFVGIRSDVRRDLFRREPRHYASFERSQQ